MPFGFGSSSSRSISTRKMAHRRVLAIVERDRALAMAVLCEQAGREAAANDWLTVAMYHETQLEQNSQ